MALKVRCPNCGKSTRLPEIDAGLPAVCTACGLKYVVPADAPRAQPGAGASADDEPVAGSRAGFGIGAWITVALSLAAATAALVSHFRHTSVDLPTLALAEPSVATLLQLKSQADALALDGRLEDSHARYEDLNRLVAGSQLRDPQAKSLFDDARASEARVFELLLDKQQRAMYEPPLRETRAESPRPPEPDSAVAPPPENAPVTTADLNKSLTAITAKPSAAAAEKSADSIPAAMDKSVATTKASVPGIPDKPVSNRRQQRAVNRPALHPMPEEKHGVTDEEIGEAIQNGVNWLMAQFDPKLHTLGPFPETSDAYGGGMDALAVYALMQSGKAISDRRLNIRGGEIEEMIEAMKRWRLDRGHPQTYARGIRATALSLYNRSQDKPILKQDVQYLLQSQFKGAYTYSRPPQTGPQKGMPSGTWDNSNSQYGLLGVWSGAEAEIEVPGSYWVAVEKHWTDCQLPTGEWGYAMEPSGRLSMTVAGIASLFVTHDYIRGAQFGRSVGRDPFSPPLAKGLAWLERDHHAVNGAAGGGYFGYSMYGIERVGLASGFKFFGDDDWYRALSEQIVHRQRRNGSWGDVVDTSFALLFLSRGRHPILMNKLRFDHSADGSVGAWANRPRDTANLARFASKQLERELNWQVVPLRKDWTDWVDSPVLYLASHKPPKLSSEEVDKIRNFILAGGTLFTQRDGDDPAFDRFAEKLARDLFPDYEMQKLGEDHELYRVVFKVDAHDVPLRVVSNGSRLLMVHSPQDLAKSWQLRDDKTKRAQFQFGVNLFVYAAGKRDLHNRLDSTVISDPGIANAKSGNISLALLKYGANWDPEPGAMPRFARWMERQTGTGVELKTVNLSELKQADAPIAHLTGTARWIPTAKEVAAVKNYVEAGGVLLVDACGGENGFGPAAQLDLIAKALPQARHQSIGDDHPILLDDAPGMDDLTHVRLRPFAVSQSARGSGSFTIYSSGKGHVIFTNLDITSGLLGTGTWGISGYEPSYSLAFVKNLIYWTIDGQPDPAEKQKISGASVSGAKVN